MTGSVTIELNEFLQVIELNKRALERNKILAGLLSEVLNEHLTSESARMVAERVNTKANRLILVRGHAGWSIFNESDSQDDWDAGQAEVP